MEKIGRVRHQSRISYDNMNYITRNLSRDLSRK